MNRPELSETLLALVQGILAAPESGLVVEHAELEVPLEVVGGVEEGRLVIRASPPFTRWKSGVLPPVHLSRLRFARVAEETEIDCA